MIRMVNNNLLVLVTFDSANDYNNQTSRDIELGTVIETGNVTFPKNTNVYFDPKEAHVFKKNLKYGDNESNSGHGQSDNDDYPTSIWYFVSAKYIRASVNIDKKISNI